MRRYTTGPETARLTHRAFVIDDAPAFFGLNGNPEVMQYTGEPLLESVTAARTAIEEYRDFDLYGYGRWACVLKETDEIIGFCGLKYLTELKLVDVGYRFLPRYWGHGFATEACQASVEFGFSQLGLKQIYGFVIPGNIASIRVLEKSGLTEAGSIQYEGENVLKYVYHRRERPMRGDKMSTEDRVRRL